ncbi:MAG TPA: carboxypeptidase-like regulatory domain-containing protein, partial [Mangrovimonas sp.]|nr:carboxypeptidase-like regulatory domain-containing protein [Mangrovimonas sp.]
MKFKFIFLMLFQFGYLFAQDLEVTGTVVSSTDGMPLPGVAIVVKGTTNGTATDFDGNFTLNKISKGDILQISYLGYITQELTVGDSLVFNIALDESNEQLDEVVVTGYSTQKKADITGAVAVVDMDEVNKQVEPNPIKALQGRIPGVQISTDGSPSGGNTGILIRGVGT